MSCPKTHVNLPPLTAPLLLEQWFSTWGDSPPPTRAQHLRVSGDILGFHNWGLLLASSEKR